MAAPDCKMDYFQARRWGEDDKPSLAEEGDNVATASVSDVGLASDLLNNVPHT